MKELSILHANANVSMANGLNTIIQKGGCIFSIKIAKMKYNYFSLSKKGKTI